MVVSKDTNRKQIAIDDWSNTTYLCKLMDNYGDSNFPFIGKNEEGEDISISIFHDKIVLVTYQSNKWVRKNLYYRDGTAEEMFEGRWQSVIS